MFNGSEAQPGHRCDRGGLGDEHTLTPAGTPHGTMERMTASVKETSPVDILLISVAVWKTCITPGRGLFRQHSVSRTSPALGSLAGRSRV